MKFLVPFASDEQEQENVYRSIRKSVLRYQGARVSNQRIRLLEYVDRGRSFSAEVGRLHPGNGEMVMAIFQDAQHDLFYICTPHRGVWRDLPMTVRGHTVKAMREFTAQPPSAP